MNKTKVNNTTKCSNCKNSHNCSKIRRFRYIIDNIEEINEDFINIDVDISIKCNNYQSVKLEVPQHIYDDCDGTINFN